MPLSPLIAQTLTGKDSLLQSLTLVAGLVLLTAWLMMRIIKRRRSAAGSLTPAEQVERLRQARGMRGDMEDLMVEIEQMAKRLGAQLDNKSAQLDKLIRDADARIARLSESAASLPPSPFSSSAAAPASDPKVQAVYELADQGLPTEAIAQKLGEHAGKVELILALRQR